MPQEEELKLWQAIERDLARARQLLPEAANSAAAGMLFQEFLDHNELGLACSALEDCGIEHSPGRSFGSRSAMLPRKWVCQSRLRNTND